jgi:hypothetical protein
VITLLLAYGGIAAVTLSQLGGGSVLGFQGEITSILPSVGVTPNPPGGGSQGPGTQPGGSGGHNGGGQYRGTVRVSAHVSPVKLQPLLHSAARS